MTLQEFKQSYGVASINLYKSTVSDRLVGSVQSTKGEFTVITKPPFVSSDPVFAYPTEVVNADTGEVSTIIVLSNKAPKAPALTL